MATAGLARFRAVRAAIMLTFVGLLEACSPVPSEPAPVYIMNRMQQTVSHGPAVVAPSARTVEARRVVAQPETIISNPQRSPVLKQAAGGGQPHQAQKGKATAHRPNPRLLAARRAPKMIPLDEPAAPGVDEPAAMPSQGAVSSDGPRSSWASPAPADDPAAPDSRRSTP